MVLPASYCGCTRHFQYNPEHISIITNKTKQLSAKEDAFFLQGAFT
jgi:hypothetical protein